MTSRYSATLNNTTLASLDSSIYLLDIQYQPVELQDKAINIAKRHGARLIDRSFGMSSVRILFEIHEYGIDDRQDVCGKIVKWAKNGGVLETNDRSGQYLQCVCTEFPVISSAKNWTDPLSITFTAFEIPFWQGKTAVTKTLTGTSDEDLLTVPGNVDGALVEADITANASLSSVALSVNNRTLTLSELNASQSDVIKITYDEKAIQSIKLGNTSLMDKRTGVDDLLANCGESNLLEISASASVSVEFKIKGLWL